MTDERARIVDWLRALDLAGVYRLDQCVRQPEPDFWPKRQALIVPTVDGHSNLRQPCRQRRNSWIIENENAHRVPCMDSVSDSFAGKPTRTHRHRCALPLSYLL